jgi:hypothetical protein
MIRHSNVSRLSGVLVGGLLCTVAMAACSGSSTGSGFPDDGTGNGNGADAGPGGTGTIGNPNGNGNTGTIGGNGNPTPGGADAACAGESATAQQQPLDIFIMLDQSGSMDEKTGNGSSKWVAVTGALNAFVAQPSAAGIGVGIQYFGLPPGGGGGGGGGGGCTNGASCSTSADCGGGTCTFGVCLCTGGGGGGGGGADSCNAADYAKPEVEIAPLPGVGAAITASIANHSPTTATPTSAALQGAVDHAGQWAAAHTGHVTIALLATDGDPTECDTSINNIAAIAAKAAGATPKIQTFVIGVGSSLTNLNAIAAAGGTQKAFIVDTNATNVNQQFLDALNKIRGSALGCTYKIPVPTSGTINYDTVNVQYTPGGTTTPVIIPKVSDKSKCVAGIDSWYYDNNTKPTQILLCADSCTKIAGDAKATVSVVSGCAQVVR